MTANINIKTDADLKTQADALFAELGMNMSVAINVFLRQAVYENRIPFEIYRDEIPNELTKKTIMDAEKGIGLSPAYDNMEDLKKALDA